MNPSFSSKAYIFILVSPCFLKLAQCFHRLVAVKNTWVSSTFLLRLFSIYASVKCRKGKELRNISFVEPFTLQRYSPSACLGSCTTPVPSQNLKQEKTLPMAVTFLFGAHRNIEPGSFPVESFSTVLVVVAWLLAITIRNLSLGCKRFQQADN